jgi:hypothetical protein
MKLQRGKDILGHGAWKPNEGGIKNAALFLPAYFSPTPYM